MEDEQRALAARAWTAEQRAIILAAYQTERAADAATLDTLTAIFATSVAALGLIGSAFAFAGHSGLSGWITPFIPVVPLPLIAWGAACVSVTIARGRLIDIYEDELRYIADVELGGVPVPAGQSLLGSWWQGRDGNVAMITGLVALLVMYFGIVAASAYESYRTNVALGFLPSVPCAVVVGFLVWIYLRAFNAEALISRLAKTSFGKQVVLTGRPAKGEPTSVYKVIDALTKTRRPGGSVGG